MSMVHVNGELLPEQTAHISVYDRGFLLGDGLFETMRATRGRVLHLDQHLARLGRGATVLGLDLPSQAELADAVRSTLAANDLSSREAVVRLTVSRGVGPRGLAPPLHPSPTVVIVAMPLTAHQPLQQTAITLPFRLDAASPLVGLKTLNYLPQVLGRRAALAAGADEGIFLNHADALVEGCASNLFWVQGNLLCTPDLTCGPLPGITRAIALTLASALGFLVREGVFSRSALADADEAFLTNSVAGLMPLTRLDERAIGQGQPGPVTAQLQAALQQTAAA
jgi:branched-chain amino acid aminotransferase